MLIEDRERGWVYRTSVPLSKDTLNFEDKDVRISPSMSVSVEVNAIGENAIFNFKVESGEIDQTLVSKRWYKMPTLSVTD